MIRFHQFAVPLALGASLLIGLSGCESDGDEPLAYEHRTIRGDARGDVPAGARLMKEGHEPLLFEAPQDGNLYVYNSSDERLVYSGAIRAGQNVNVDPDHDFVTVDGRKVVDMKMDDFDNHQILFAPAAVSAGSQTDAAQPASVTVEPSAPVTIERQPTEVRVQPDGEVQVQPSGVRVVPSE